MEGVLRPQRPSEVRGARVAGTLLFPLSHNALIRHEIRPHFVGLAAPKKQGEEKEKAKPGPETDKRCAMIVRELFDTEKTYVSALQQLVKVLLLLLLAH